ncbi:T7SS effector LXG polymorphic toxin [Halobacillus shinanisalinarum]|uniref:T7SS effector LXG polymorphic toxin n=1 Tax=Halobacillus shinanisalinarum TaxID=2932258 RepID=A0ABY4H4Q5_9BACI|nr:T7SS effector LXG polymorphic toxin [Halobacillus shinanisalinarum]UOQ94880.1 T7SS effector LXG polymorphic toxin [Halobacillus shinanisalinarum]
MKVLDVSDLQKGGEETIHTLDQLRNSIHQVKVSIKTIIHLEDSLRGQGGEAIRTFYQEAHLPFLSYLEQFLSQYEDAIRKMLTSLHEFEPDSDGVIREDFLEQEVEAGLHKASTVTTEIIQEVNQVVGSVQDIVALPSIDDSKFLQEIQQAWNKKDETVERLHEFDQTESSQLAELRQSLSTMNQYIESISSQFEAGDISIGSYQAGQLQSNMNGASINLATNAKVVPPDEVDGFISEQKRMAPVSLGYEFTSEGVCTREDMMAPSSDASKEDVTWWKKTASFVLDFIPIVGNVKAAIETNTGENLITGVEYEGWERALLAASVVGGGFVKVVGKGAKGVSSVVKNGDEVVEGVRKATPNGFQYWNKTTEFKNVKVYQRDDIINLNTKDARGRTNFERMKKGLAPLGPDGKSINLHHMTQRNESAIAEVTHTFHKDNSLIIHINPNTIPSGINRAEFNKWRNSYWKNRAREKAGGEK